MKRHVTSFSRKLSHRNYSSISPQRSVSTKEAIERRNHLFSLEKKRQVENVGRIEKIEVQYQGVPKNVSLIMNKDLSTPYDCARHLTEWHVETSALALLDGTQVNKAFWRTCSMMLGACATVAFKDTVAVKLHSFPGPDIRSGSFIYDIDLPSLPDWKPSTQELQTLSAECVKLARAGLALERLEVSEELAQEIFVGDEHKSQQVPSIARHADGKVTLYRMDKHIDISKGPMISNTSQIGVVTVASVHKLQ
ncbi:Mitochondrial ribosomal protein L39, partial [Operophtera brumata]